MHYTTHKYKVCMTAIDGQSRAHTYGQTYSIYMVQFGCNKSRDAASARHAHRAAAVLLIFSARVKYTACYVLAQLPDLWCIYSLLGHKPSSKPWMLKHRCSSIALSSLHTVLELNPLVTQILHMACLYEVSN